MPRAEAAPVPPGCSASGWGGGMSSGCQILHCHPRETSSLLAPGAQGASALPAPWYALRADSQNRESAGDHHLLKQVLEDR